MAAPKCARIITLLEKEKEKDLREAERERDLAEKLKSVGAHPGDLDIKAMRDLKLGTDAIMEVKRAEARAASVADLPKSVNANKVGKDGAKDGATPKGATPKGDLVDRMMDYAGVVASVLGIDKKEALRAVSDAMDGGKEAERKKQVHEDSVLVFDEDMDFAYLVLWIEESKTGAKIIERMKASAEFNKKKDVEQGVKDRDAWVAKKLRKSRGAATKEQLMRQSQDAFKELIQKIKKQHKEDMQVIESIPRDNAMVNRIKEVMATAPVTKEELFEEIEYSFLARGSTLHPKFVRDKTGGGRRFCPVTFHFVAWGLQLCYEVMFVYITDTDRSFRMVEVFAELVRDADPFSDGAFKGSKTAVGILIQCAFGAVMRVFFSVSGDADTE